MTNLQRANLGGATTATEAARNEALVASCTESLDTLMKHFAAEMPDTVRLARRGNASAIWSLRLAWARAAKAVV